MSINILPEEYQRELKTERLRRLTVVAGIAVFLITAVNIILLSPMWILFAVQEREALRQLESIKNSPAFLRAAVIESEVGDLNFKIKTFNDLEKSRFKISPAISSVLSGRPAGISVTGIVFTLADPRRNQPPQISVQGVAANRDLLLSFAAANRTGGFFSNINSPISNLLKENNLDYTLVFDLVHE